MKKIFILALAALGMLACTGQNDPSKPDTPSTPAIEGELSGVFSVSPSKKVHFSQGNLQYQATTNTWRFAKYQYEYCSAAANENASATFAGWIDQYCWGATGFNNRFPYIKYGYEKEYYVEGDIDHGNEMEIIDSIIDSRAENYDFGIYNPISNGGNKAGLWRMLTGDEWEYLMHGRKDAEYLFALGMVNDVRGLIILPDNWKEPSGLTFNPSTLKGMTYYEYDEHDAQGYANLEADYGKSEDFNYADNIYTVTQWEKMEAAGAVFLPVIIRLVGRQEGGYWSSSYVPAYGENTYEGKTGVYIQSYGITFNIPMIGGPEYVRLVRDVK